MVRWQDERRRMSGRDAVDGVVEARFQPVELLWHRSEGEFVGLWAQLSCWIEAFCAAALCREQWWLRPEAMDPAQDLVEQLPRHRHLGQLEDDIAAMADDPGADLHQPFAQGRE